MPFPAVRGLPFVLALVLLGAGPGSRSQNPSSFAGQIATLSEPGGYFDTDNLVSNERSYLQVLPALQRTIQGGAYIGVGPDQNFSYVAALRPQVAFIIDIRRDNLLLHLLFKALFALSDTRLEYLAHLLGRPVPASPGKWREAPLERVIELVDRPPAGEAAIAAVGRRLDAAIRRTGVPLGDDDVRTIARFHRRFIEAGVELRFNSAGRPPQSYYPTYRELLLETDAEGRQASFLATDEAFQFVRRLQARDLVIPVVGDLSGPTALAGVGGLLASRRQQVSALYVSNVEFYLYRQDAYPKFIANVQRVPRTDRSVIIRSIFGRYTMHRRPGDVSTSELQPMADLLDGFGRGLFRSYGQLAGGR